MTHLRGGAVLVLCGVLLSGCGPAGGVTSSSPVVTVSPVVSPSPGVSSSAVLYAEAERVFRAYYSEHLKLEVAGGADVLPPVFDQYVTDPYRTELAEAFASAKHEGRGYTNGVGPKVASVEPLPELHLDNSEATVRVCIDGRGTLAVDAQGKQFPGRLVAMDFFFRNDLATVKIFDAKFTQDASCKSPS